MAISPLSIYSNWCNPKGRFWGGGGASIYIYIHKIIVNDVICIYCSKDKEGKDRGLETIGRSCHGWNFQFQLTNKSYWMAAFLSQLVLRSSC